MRESLKNRGGPLNELFLKTSKILSFTGAGINCSLKKVLIELFIISEKQIIDTNCNILKSEITFYLFIWFIVS